MMVISNRAVLSPESVNDADRGQNDRAKNGVSSVTRDYRLREMNRNHENANDLNLRISIYSSEYCSNCAPIQRTIYRCRIDAPSRACNSLIPLSVA